MIKLEYNGYTIYFDTVEDLNKFLVLKEPTCGTSPINNLEKIDIE